VLTLLPPPTPTTERVHIQREILLFDPTGATNSREIHRRCPLLATRLYHLTADPFHPIPRHPPPLHHPHTHLLLRQAHLCLALQF
jgi:hypothetical protein